MKKEAQAILKKCLEHEKEGLDFYLEVAEIVAKERTRQAFETLAQEERAHIRSLFDHYQGEEIGDVEAFLARPAHIESPLIKELEAAVDEMTTDRKALMLAMRLEQKNREDYLRHAAESADEECRAVFERLARDEERHYQIVESEYAHLMGMVHETDIDTFVRE